MMKSMTETDDMEKIMEERMMGITGEMTDPVKEDPVPEEKTKEGVIVDNLQDIQEITPMKTRIGGA